MGEIIIRKMKEADLTRVMEIFAYARDFMKRTGNPNQWFDYWPDELASREDIENGTGYVLVEDDHIFATFAFIIGEDPTYLKIDPFCDETFKNKEQQNYLKNISLDDKGSCLGKKINCIENKFDASQDREYFDDDFRKFNLANGNFAKTDEAAVLNKSILPPEGICAKTGRNFEYSGGGAWLNDKPYGTIHRLAGDGTHRGVFETVLAFCENQVDNVRADTHEDNKILQHKFFKNGFKPCGIIYVRDHMPRLAFQKIVR